MFYPCSESVSLNHVSKCISWFFFLRKRFNFFVIAEFLALSFPSIGSVCREVKKHCKRWRQGVCVKDELEIETHFLGTVLVSLFCMWLRK